MALPKSVCDNCVNTECLWRAPTGGKDPPVMICPNKIEKPQTNADRIRAMTDEELADFMIRAAIRGGKPTESGLVHWRDWLKEETEK